MKDTHSLGWEKNGVWGGWLWFLLSWLRCGFVELDVVGGLAFFIKQCIYPP